MRETTSYGAISNDCSFKDELFQRMVDDHSLSSSQDTSKTNCSASPSNLTSATVAMSPECEECSQGRLSERLSLAGCEGDAFCSLILFPPRNDVSATFDDCLEECIADAAPLLPVRVTPQVFFAEERDRALRKPSDPEEENDLDDRTPVVDSRKDQRSSFGKSFLDEFRRSRGGLMILLLGFLTAIGWGCIMGVVPQIATQAYAERVYGYGPNDDPCSAIALNKPQACIQGSEHAQNVASSTAFARYTMAILSNSIVGSYSDQHGRKGVQVTCLALLFFGPISLTLVQLCSFVGPVWFFVADSLASIIHVFSIAFTQLSDIMPNRHRAISYGLFVGSFMSGIAIAPYFASIMSHLHVAMFASAVRGLALLLAIRFLPETLPTESRIRTNGHDALPLASSPDETCCFACVNITGTFRAMSILGRSRHLVLLSVAAFASKLVFSADLILFFFYAEGNLGVNDKDVASMMFLAGMVGVLVQAGLLKHMISLFGERGSLIVCFCSGIMHNLIYGLSDRKWQLYIGLCLAQFSNASSPLLSSLASKCVEDFEQGRIQGALFSLTSIAEAFGPLSFNFIYHHFDYTGPGTMFLFGAAVYLVGLIAVALTRHKR